MMNISVICPIYNEEKYIACCINSLLLQDFSWDDSEILLVDGMSTDRTRTIISEFADKHKFIRLLNNPNKVTPTALNIGIRESKNEIIFRIDVHTYYPPSYFSILTEQLIKLGADNVGGICRTLPAGNGPVPNAIAKAMGSLFGVGNSLFRIGTKEIRNVDTVPFGCFRREVFDRIGMFDEELTRNQDDEFNGRIIKNGGKIYLIPNVVIDYYARDKIMKVSQMFYQYGFFKPLVNKKLGAPATLRQFFPFLFVFLILLGGLFSLFYHIIFIFYLVILLLYSLLSLYFSFKATTHISQILLLPFVFFVIHVSYGLGYIHGIVRFLILKKSVINVEVNR
jgi:glycosyltransferase involved in cell wall biosynthesis